jgi:hypothetical protein
MDSAYVLQSIDQTPIKIKITEEEPIKTKNLSDNSKMPFALCLPL